MQKNPLSCFQTLILAELTRRQKDFTKQPNANNWNRCVEAMLTHQQLEYAIRSRQINPQEMAEDLRGRSDWHNVVCEWTLNMSCADALREAGSGFMLPTINADWPVADAAH
jgi:hypothetical protein